MPAKGQKGPPSIWKGDHYGRLTVLENGQGRDHILCQCACGAFKRILGQNLRQGNTLSCGCLKTDKEHRKHWINSRKA